MRGLFLFLRQFQSNSLCSLVLYGECLTMINRIYESVKYRMLRDEAEDPKLARKNIRREEWKSHDFLVDQFWDIDHRYFGDFLSLIHI